MDDTLPQLNEDQIREWAFGASFSRGYIYYERGAIVNPRRTDTTLRAQCWGSASQPYQVQATLGTSGIQSAYCTCPVGAGGACKHVVAMLLTWLYEPQRFQVVASLEESLHKRSKEELVELILKLVARDPALEPLLEMPLPGRAPERQPLNPDLIRRRMHAIIDHVPYEWGASYAAAGEIREIIGDGDAYAQAGDWLNAAIVYCTVAEEILESIDNIYQEEDEYIVEISRCVRGLDECQQHIEDNDERRAIMRVLFKIVRWDITYGGVGLGDEAAFILTEETTPEERAEIAQWARELLPEYEEEEEEDSFSRQWRLQALGGLLLALERDALDDEAFIVLCRETRRLRDLVRRLLELGRVQEAAEEARRASDYELIALSQDIRDAGHAELAEQLLWERRETTKDTRVLQRLLTWVQERGDAPVALALADQIFQIGSHLEHYRMLRAAAQAAGRWPQVEQEVLERLTAQNKGGLLIEIHLEEGRIDEALASLHESEQAGGPWHFRGISTSLRLKVAQAAETERPEAAIEIYLAEVEKLTRARGRDNYATAARYLTRVRDILQGNGEKERWRTLIARIRDENRRLPALKDELNRAGL